MTLSEQLDELRNSILRDRSDIIAGDKDSLWSDETLIRYIKDAEHKFTRETLCLRDSTTLQVTRVKLRAGVKLYTLDKSIISVLSARYDTSESDLARSGHSVVNAHVPTSYPSFNPAATYHFPPGDPIAYQTDETLVTMGGNFGVSLGVFPAPGVTTDSKYLYLRVIRQPIVGYGIDCLDRESEIPENYQLDVLEWAAYRALSTFDADAGAPTTAAAHKAAYQEAVKACVREIKRMMFTNIGWNNGRNGFRWTR